MWAILGGLNVPPVTPGGGTKRAAFGFWYSEIIGLDITGGCLVNYYHANSK